MFDYYYYFYEFQGIADVEHRKISKLKDIIFY